MPASPRLRGIATPGDLGTLTEDVGNTAGYCTTFANLIVQQMQGLNTSDYRGHSWPDHDEEDSYPL